MFKKNLIMLACSLAIAPAYASTQQQELPVEAPTSIVGANTLSASVIGANALSDSAKTANKPSASQPGKTQGSFLSMSLSQIKQGNTNKSAIQGATGMVGPEGNQGPAAAACVEYTEFASLTGQDLFDFVRTTDFNCISDLYRENDATAVAAYQATNVAEVANLAKAMAASYDSTTGSEMLNLFYFLRGAFYIEYYNDDLTYGDDTASHAVRDLLVEYTKNPNFADTSSSQGNTLAEFFITWDSSGSYYEGAEAITNYLEVFSPEHLANADHRYALTKALTTLYYGSWDATYTGAAEEHTALINGLLKIATSEYIYNSDYSYESTDAFHEFGRFFEYQEYWGLSAALKTRLNEGVVEYMNNFERMSSEWADAAGYLDWYNPGECEQFGICGWADELEATILSINYSCSDTIDIRAQQLTNEELQASCDLMGGEEVLFHQVLATAHQPVADDNNTNLEVNIFDSYDDYNQYAGIIFGIGTDNGGMYLEGTPSDVDNQARFIAHEATWTDEILVWNLRHEYVHYLDGRFNQYGAFNYFDIDTGKSVWWSEGLAEYISHQNRYDEAVEIGRSQSFSLSEILSNTYDSGSERVYRWGYLGVRFLFENHRADVDQLLVLARGGDASGWLDYIDNQIGNNYDAEWNTWLSTVTSNDAPLAGCEGDECLPPPCEETNTCPPVPCEETNTCPVEPCEETNSCPPEECTDEACDPTNSNLVDGVAKIGVSGGTAYYYIWVPEGTENIQFSSTAGTGDANLYVKAGAWATSSDYDQASENAGNDESVLVTEVVGGDYYYVTLDSSDAFDGLNLLAEFNVETDPVDPVEPIEVIELQSGVRVKQLASDDALYFKIFVPGDMKKVKFIMSRGKGEADMYVRFGAIPTTQEYDFADTKDLGRERVIIKQPEGEDFYYVMLKARDGDFSKIRLKAKIKD